MTLHWPVEQYAMPMSEPREYRCTDHVKLCEYGFCDQEIDLNLFPKPNGKYVRGIGWCCPTHVLACEDKPEGDAND